MELFNNFNGLSLTVIIVLSYCAVLKNTTRAECTKKEVLTRRYQ